MSYSIYKSIKQNKDGSFDCVVASNNLISRAGGYVWEKYHMTYFNEKYSAASNAQKRALLLITSLYCGDKYHPAAWREDLEIVGLYDSKGLIEYDRLCADSAYALEVASRVAEYIEKIRKANRDSKYIIRLKDGRFVYKLMPDGSAKVTNRADNAKIFNNCPEILEKKCIFIKKYIDNYIKVC